jgi:hypothetical protein
MNKRWGFLVALFGLGTALVSTNPWFTVLDDECAIISAAAQPLSYTVKKYVSGAGQHEHPPLYDLIFHVWLSLTNGNIHLLRVPAVVFYLLGIWALACAGKYLSQDKGVTWVFVLTVFWPFGFHFGRVAAWYSFCFLLVSLLTWAHLRYIERPTLTRWIGFVLCALALVYSNYFGWALVGLLILDLAIRDVEALARQWKRLATGILLLVVAYLPVLRAFLGELHHGIHAGHSLLSTGLLGIYNLFCIFVSESVAPWYWMLGVPAGIAVALCITAVLWAAPAVAKRFLFYFIALLGTMTILRIVETKRLLFIAPWLILSVALMLSSLPRDCVWRRLSVLSLIVVSGIGWYGVFARTLYAAPRWLEPWNEVAHEAAGVAQSGGIVIGNNPSFFFYLTYQLPDRDHPLAVSRFPGLLPAATRRDLVYDPQQWLTAGKRLGPTVFLVKGLHYGTPEAPTDEAERYLDNHCKLTNVEKKVHDSGAVWKARFAPDTGQIPWRIQLRSYSCSSGRG